MPGLVLVWDDRLDDYYVGVQAAIYKDGRRVWLGFSADEVENILEVALGDAPFEVYRIRSTAVGWEFPELLADIPEIPS